MLNKGEIMTARPNIVGDVVYKGIKIHYEYFGKKDSPVVVIQNGISMETASWHQFIIPVMEKVDVLLWDFRGQGQSTSDDNPYMIEDFADYLKAIIEELKLEPKNVNLLGISFGSLVTVEFMRKYGKLANKAVLLGSILSNERIFFYRTEVEKKLVAMEMVDIWADMLYCSLFSENFLKTIESFIPKMKESLCNRYKNRKISLLRLFECEENYVANIENYYSDFKKICNPILMIGGEYDILIPTYIQKKGVKLFQNAKYLEYSEAGHIVYMEKPKEFFTQVIDFILK